MKVSQAADIERYYKALVERDSQYVGIFYVAVKTTGIFCIATCSARKPLLKNVEFYTSSKEPLQEGFRPCKVCKPTENTHQPPEEILMLIRMLNEDQSLKLSDANLRDMGYTPETVRRWFNKHYGMTFQTYQRMLRINQAYVQLKGGAAVTASAFDSGYESLSGFGYAFKTLTGLSPENAAQKAVLNLTRIPTPLGAMFACASDKGLCLLEFTDREVLQKELRDLCKRLKAIILQGENDHLRQLRTELDEYFSGSRKQFTVALDMPGTDFQQEVWEALLKVPFGETSTYGKQARRIGRDKAVRAVGTANGCNRISIVVPCHRIIGSDGRLTGYGGGLPRKQWLLEHEKKHSSQ
ncbi:MAG: bifunctional transcriptional activator/DNA repair enzyme AdaA [Calditrichia bacterium]